MSNETKKRWKGLKNLVADAVVHGSSAVEKVHLATTNRTFAVLEALPGIELPAKPLHIIHDLSVKSVYGTIRAVTAVVSGVIDVAIDVAEKKSESPEVAAPEETKISSD
ncbi:MAG: hypothetical protein ABI461_02060 [Polyangiaceae bacterium]